jgi:hypothetical protein
MNTAEVKVGLTGVPVQQAKNVVDLEKYERVTKTADIARGDSYSASSTADKFVAKVLSFSISQRFESELNTKSDQSQSKRPVRQSVVFDIDLVTNNVINYVSSALQDLSANGADANALSYFRDKAIEGVETGVKAAKQELIGIADDQLLAQVDLTRTSIIEGIEALSNDPNDYKLSSNASENSALGQISVTTRDNQTLTINFGEGVFGNDASDENTAQFFTTQASNLSFSIENIRNEATAEKLASFVNSADDLINSFYRGGVSTAYDKSLALGYDDKELSGLAKNDAMERLNAKNAYGDIKHFKDGMDSKELSSPKAVVMYVSKLMNLMEKSNELFDDEGQYKDIINGIVNQMSDVQVPDIVQAINKFYTFNSKFSD